MKHIIYIILYLFVLVILVGCSQIQVNEDLEFKIDVIGMDGSGTKENPHYIQIHVQSSFTLNYSVTPMIDEQPTLILVKKENEDFMNLRSKDLKGLKIDNNKDEIIITGLLPGAHYIQMTLKNKSIYIHVDVVENEQIKQEIDFNKRLKVLAIGNSFSDDSMAFLYDIANSYGVENIVLGNLVIGGATLQTHVAAAAERSKAYAYRKLTEGKWVTQMGTTTAEGIADEAWDIITIQQGSGSSGVKETYDEYLLQMIHIIRAYQTNPHAQIYWHMTWAYQQSSTHAEFINYQNNQQTMYEMILETYQTKVKIEERITGLIPSGTAIQNVRTSFIGDTLTRDGYHLSYDIGRFVAGLTWFRAITGLPLEGVSFVPMGISPTYVEAIKASVSDAIENPFNKTQSTYIETPVNDVEYHLEDMEQITPTYTVGYWHALLSNAIYTEASNAIYFIANEVRLTPEDLPVGSLLLLEAGYQYRINYFSKDGSLLFNIRTDPITRDVFIITPYVWQDYGYIGINIFSITPNMDISDQVEYANEILKIYIPLKAA